MDFLLSPEGLFHNVPGLALLAYLLWQRSMMGGLLAALAGVHVFGPILGAGQWVPFNVHMTPAVMSLTAYRLLLWASTSFQNRAASGVQWSLHPIP